MTDSLEPLHPVLICAILNHMIQHNQKIRYTEDYVTFAGLSLTPLQIDELIPDLKRAADLSTRAKLKAYEPGDRIEADNGLIYVVDSVAVHRFGEMGEPTMSYRCSRGSKDMQDAYYSVWHSEVKGLA